MAHIFDLRLNGVSSKEPTKKSYSSELIPKEIVRCVKDDIKEALRRYEFSHITLEIEYGDDDCAMAM